MPSGGVTRGSSLHSPRGFWSITCVIPYSCDYSALEHHTLARRFSERQIKPAHEFLRQYIVKRRQEGAFRACDPDVTVRAFAGMLMYHLLVTKLFETDTCQAPGESVVKNFTRLLLDGLRHDAP
jgi:hypothetical protein